MAERDRLLHPVTASLAAVLLMLLAAGLVNHQRTYHEVGGNRETTASYEAQDPSRFSGYKNPKDVAAAIDGERDFLSEDLSAQKSMARAAWAAFAISVAGLLGLGFTVVFAALAWNAAADGAKAAWKAEESARKMGMAQVRAYLTFENAVFVFERGEFRLRFEIHNCGQSPARFVVAKRVSCIVCLKGTASEDLRFVGAYGDTMNVLLGGHKAGGTKSVSIPMSLGYDDFRALEREVRVRGGIVTVSGIFTWEDVFDVRHRLPFVADKMFESGLSGDSAGAYINVDRVTEAHVMKRWNAAFEESR